MSFIAKSTNISQSNKRTSLMLLSKEAKNADMQLKSQILMSIDEDQSQKGTEYIWAEFGFFGELNVDLTIMKVNFPELTMCYINQARVSIVKNNEQAIYCDNVIIAQIMPYAILDPEINLETYIPKENEAIIYCPLYNTTTGLFYGIARKLGLITVLGDEQEQFFSYGFSKEKSKLLYCSMKTQMPNIFSCTSFKKHKQLLLEQHENSVKQSRQFFFLPATLDRKEEFLQYKDNVNLHPIEIDYEVFSEHGIQDFNPALLERRNDANLRSVVLKIMKNAAVVSNNNLIRNANAYRSKGGEIDKEMKFQWIDESMKANQLLQLTY